MYDSVSLHIHVDFSVCVCVCPLVCICDPEHCLPPACCMAESHCIATGNGWQPISVSKWKLETQDIKYVKQAGGELENRKYNGWKDREATKTQLSWIRVQLNKSLY